MAFLHAYKKDVVMLVIKKSTKLYACSFNGDLLLLYTLGFLKGYLSTRKFRSSKIFGVRKNANKITYFAITLLLLYFEPCIIKYKIQRNKKKNIVMDITRRNLEISLKHYHRSLLQCVQLPVDH